VPRIARLKLAVFISLVALAGLWDRLAEAGHQAKAAYAGPMARAPEGSAAELYSTAQYIPTMPVATYRFLGCPGVTNYGQALAVSTLLMLVCTLGFLAIERFRVGEVGEFSGSIGEGRKPETGSGRLRSKKPLPLLPESHISLLVH
jgi:hypothetical protein